MAWFAWKRIYDQITADTQEDTEMPVLTRKTNSIPYIGETFAVITAGVLKVVRNLDDYGPATHGFYRQGIVWNVRIIEPMLSEDIYEALEVTLAHDPAVTFISCF